MPLDFGLKPLAPPGPEDLYDIINKRYERGSILLTRNRAPEEWPELFGELLLAAAGLDRLTHRAQIVIITFSLEKVGELVDDDQPEESIHPS